MKTQKIILIAILFCTTALFSQTEEGGISLDGTPLPHSNVDIDTEEVHGMLFNRVTQIELENLSTNLNSDHNGLFFYNSSEKSFYFWEDSTWVTMLNDDNLEDLIIQGSVTIDGDGESFTLNTTTNDSHNFIGFYKNGADESRSARVGFTENEENHFVIQNELEEGDITLITDGNVSVGSLSPDVKFTVDGGIQSNLSEGGYIMTNSMEAKNVVIDQRGIMARNDGNSSPLYLQQYGGDIRINTGQSEDEKVVIKGNGRIGVGTTTPTEMVDVHGNTKTEKLIITGGSDIVEDFESENGQTIAPGSIVFINEDGVSSTKNAYERRVVGVVTGANGVQHGVQLYQDDVLEGDVMIAIAGRVYVQTVGVVQIGDLLVSSDYNGKAQVATDRDKSFGAVIGKAISVPDDNGFVLMLVSIQ